MSKVIKILVSVFSVIILSGLGLLLLLSLLLELPAFQNFVVDKATELLSSKLGTTVSIDRVRLKLVSRASIEGLYIEDLHGDTLIYVGELDAGLRSAGLDGGGVMLGGVSLKKVRFYMHQVPLDLPDTTTSNLGEILARLRSDKPKKKKGAFELHASSLRIEDLRYTYRKLDPSPREGVNFQDLEVERLDLHADAIAVVGDSVSLRMRGVSLRERRSGLDIKNMSASSMNVAGGRIRIRGMQVTTPESDVKMEYVTLLGRSWKSYSQFVDSVRIEASLDARRFGYGSVARFAPGLTPWKSSYRNVRADVSGTVSDMTGEVTDFETLTTRLNGVRFAIKGLPNVPSTRFSIDVQGLNTTTHDAMWLLEDITRKRLPENTVQMLTRLGDVSFSGHFDGLLTRFKANGEVKTSRGNAAVDLAFAPLPHGLTELAGHLDVQDLDAGRLLDNRSLGMASVKGEVRGIMGGSSMQMYADAHISRLEFNGYPYRGVDLSGQFENRNFMGRLKTDTPDLSMSFDGLLDFNDSLPRYDFEMDLRHADLHKLGFNRRDSVAMLSCRITARGVGSTLDNVNGKVDIDSLTYVNHTDSVRTGLIRLTGVNNPQGKLLSLRSSIADIEFKSRLGYADLFDYLKGAMREYIPTLGTGHRQPRQVAAASPGDYYLLTMKVKQANNLAGAILPGLIIAQGTELSFMLNPRREDISLNLHSEYIEWNRLFLSNLDVNSRNQGDSLSVYARADEFFASGFYMPGLSVMGGVKDDRLRASTRFSDPEAGLSALINGEALFSKTPEGMMQTRMRIGQSYVAMGEQTWRLSSGEIVTDSLHTSIERLRIVSSNGELTAHGTASRSRQDTLRVRLSNFNLQPLTQFTTRRGYTVSGVTNGYADITSALGDGMIFSNITFDSLKVNNIKTPPLLFDTRWDMANERVRVILTDRAKADTLVQFFYRPSDRRYLGDIHLSGVDLALVDPLLKGVIRGSRGTADVDLRMTSREGSPLFNGTVRIPNLTTTVAFTNVPYTLSDATLRVKDNTFTLPSTPLRDADGNSAAMDATFIVGRNFSNYNFAINLQPRGLLVLSTTPRDNELFNGRVYASGAASIKGDKRGVAMNITATTAANSTFQMSLSGKSGIGEADFITFVNPHATADSSYYQQRKRLLMAGKGRSKSENASQLAIDMSVTALPNTELQLVIDPTMGKGIRARGNGSLNMSVNPRNGEFRMYGDYELTQGSYNLNLERLVDRTFTLNPGSVIKWTGDPADALLDVSASYHLKTSLAPLTGEGSEMANTTVPVDCSIVLTDRLLKPNIAFKVEVEDSSAEIQNLVANSLNTPELMSTQFLWLVAFKRFYSDNTSQSNIGSVGAGATAFDFLTGTLSNALSSDKYNLGISYRPKDEISSDELDIDFSTSILGQRLFLEIEGNYDFDNNAASKVNANSSNLTGDFALRYLVDRAGNIQTKVFSRTINTYDENQGLQESGVGIYYHEDFNSMRDLTRNMRQRFSRKNRKQIQTDTVKNEKNIQNK